MNPAEFISLATANPVNRIILERLPHLDLTDVWLVSGALFQTVWNGLTGRQPTYGIKDYDVIYYDTADLSWEAEDRVITRVQKAFDDLNGEIEIRNQARVHLWYERKFGKPYPRLHSAAASIDRYLATACMVGVRADANAQFEVYAPRGYDDIEGMIIRPNPTPNFAAKRYGEKSQRWKQAWPELSILPAETN